MRTEKWREIEGTLGVYEVSDWGRVRRVKHVPHARPPGILKPKVPSHGYPAVTLAGGRQELVHSLVAAAFLGPRPDGNYVDHIDGDKKNPKLVNLEYVSPGENAKRAYAIGLKKHIQPTGDANPATKLSKEQVVEIKSTPYRRGGDPYFARKFGVSTSAVYYVRTGRNHVSY